MTVIFSRKMNKLKKIIVRFRDTTERWVVISDYFRSPESQIESGFMALGSCCFRLVPQSYPDQLGSGFMYVNGLGLLPHFMSII